MEVSKGIQNNFYEELVSIDSKEGKIHFLAPLS